MARQPPPIPPSEVTPESVYQSRRSFLKHGAALALLPVLSACERSQLLGGSPTAGPLPTAADAGPLTSFQDATSYNNFYEFGTGKGDPAAHAHTLRTRPWTVTVDGLVARPATFDIDTLLRQFPGEERIYRLRCVEAWSMVLPWTGFELGRLLRAVEPLPAARFVEFTTLHDPEQMRGQKRRWLDWPYREGLRLDEAMHPLTILASGLYGRDLPNQNGAPLRLVCPWKYGFKGAKSIVRIRLTDTMPRSAWMVAAPDEYGFYANVNPDVPHPRWSQATERRIGEQGRRKTLLFNGYAEQVAHLYAGLDLRRNF